MTKKLQKIDMTEMMSDSELDLVNGGSASETCKDSFYLKKLGFCDKSYNMENIIFGFAYNKAKETVKLAWNKIGVKVFTNFWDDNEYSYNNQKISREQAFAIAAKASKTPNIYYKRYL